MNKNKLSIFLIPLVLALMLVSCSDNTPGVSVTDYIA